MKKLLLVLLFFPLYLQAQNFQQDEITVFNQSSHSIVIKLYPVSMVFNRKGVYYMVAEDRKTTTSTNHNQKFDYINGTAYNGIYPQIYEFTVPPNGGVGWNNDCGGGRAVTSCYGSFGTGQYKLEIRHYDTDDEEIGDAGLLAIDSCIIEYDYILNTDYYFTDLGIYVLDLNLSDRFYYKFLEHEAMVQINSSNYSIKAWEPEGPTGSYTGKREKQYSELYFKDLTGSENEIYNLYSTIPLDCRKDCGVYSPYITTAQNQTFPYNWDEATETRQGVLTNYLTVSKNASTPTDYWNPPFMPHVIPIVIKQDALLKINDSIQFEIKTNSGGTMSVNIENGGRMILQSNADMIFNSNTQLSNKNGGIVGLW